MENHSYHFFPLHVSLGLPKINPVIHDTSQAPRTSTPPTPDNGVCNISNDVIKARRKKKKLKFVYTLSSSLN